MQERSVQYRQNAVFAADGGGGLHVLVGDGLAADEIGTGLQPDEGDVGGRLLQNTGFQRVQIDIALEGKIAVADKPLLFDQLLHASTQTGDMRLGGGEVVVHDDTAAGLDKAGGENVLAGPALVGGQAVLNAEQLLELGLHAEEGLAAGVGIIGLQHGRLLAVGHGVDARISEHIQENVAVMQLEGIEPGLLHFFKTLGSGQQVQLLDDLDLVHLHGDGFVFVKSNGGHSALLLEIHNKYSVV